MRALDDDISRAVAGQTIPGLFVDTVRNRGDAVALGWRDGDSFTQMSWSEYAERACRMAGALQALGVRLGERVVLMLRNRPEFHLADMGALLAGATPISIYNSSSPEQVEYLVGHCEAVTAVVDDVGILERFLKVRSELSGLRNLVVVDDPDGLAPADVLRFEQLLGDPPVDLAEAAGRARPEDLATVIYTSGTTGPPKGVMITHSNVCWVLESMVRTMGQSVAGWRVISYLPMAHIAERAVSHYLHVHHGSEVTTCPDPTALARYLPEVRPEFFFGVPRVWEKIYAGIQAAVAADPQKQAFFNQALEVGHQVAAARLSGEPLPEQLQAAWDNVDGVVFSTVRALVGLDQCRMAATAAAPIPAEVFDFFRAIGVPLSEIYGLSECTGPMTWAPHAIRPGTVGPPIAGQEVRLADDGEVLCRGGNVFPGYLKDPARTAEVLDDEGWFHTGDIGEFDEAGYLRIIDRKKELIITAGGKNVSPANLEAAIKAFPIIGQACAIGDRRPYMTALIVLDPDMAPTWAKSKGIEAASLAELAAHPDVRAEVERCVAEANSRFSQVEGIKRFHILPDEWLPDSEELTPTMKLKRRGVLAKYAEEIEGLYADPKG
jgi:long-chain acyl-CoA synthetase